MSVEENCYRKLICNLPSQVQVALPDWVENFVTAYALKKDFISNEQLIIRDQSERMKLAIILSAENIRRGTGGPFGSVITEIASGTVISVGVNRVVPESNCTAHGEMIAMQLATQSLQRFSLSPDRGEDSSKKFELCTSAEMCGMCRGATLWSGVTDIWYAATTKDVEVATGFDEGIPLSHEQKVKELAERGISFNHDKANQVDAIKVLEEYGRTGEIYNAKPTSP